MMCSANPFVLLLFGLAPGFRRAVHASRIISTQFGLDGTDARGDSVTPPGTEPLTVWENVAFKAVKNVFEGVQLTRVELGLRCLYDGQKKLARLHALEAEAEPLIERVKDIHKLDVPEQYKQSQTLKELLSRLRDMRQQARAEAEAITGLVQKLGGVFVKLAQNLAVRDDIVKSPTLRSALAVTMDANPPSDKYVAGDVIPLGGWTWTVNRSLNVGSVGEALLVSGSRGASKRVDAVLKVTFPERRAEYESDFDMLSYRYGKKQELPEGSMVKRRAMRSTSVTEEEERLYSIIRPMKDAILAEFDLTSEASKTLRGAAAVQEEAPEAHVPIVQFPTSSDALDTAAVYIPSQRSFFVSELIHGQSLKERWNAHKTWKSGDLNYLIDVYGRLMLRKGYFMADPHPGNFMVIDDFTSVEQLGSPKPPRPGHGTAQTTSRQGNGLVILDWGNTGDLPTKDRCALALFYVALVSDETSKAALPKSRGGLGLVRYSRAAPAPGARSPGPTLSDCEKQSLQCFPKSSGCPHRFVPAAPSCSTGYFSATSSHTCCAPPKAPRETLLVDYLARQLGRPDASADIVALALEAGQVDAAALRRISTAVVPHWGGEGARDVLVPAARVVQVFKGLGVQAGGELRLRELWGSIALDVLEKCNR